MTIVGIVGDMRRTGFDAPVRPETYIPIAQSPDTRMTLVVRTAGDPVGAAAEIKSLVRSLDPSVAVQALQPLDAVVAEMTAQRRLNTLLLGGFAIIAVLLAAVGLYGVMAYSVEQRTRELGVRLALGASGGGLLRLIVGEGLRLVVIGLVIGLAGAAASSRLLARLLYHVTATDPATFVTIAIATLAVAVAACIVPALRAWHVDPITALRAD
jgi:putative ABC transport system permease protein